MTMAINWPFWVVTYSLTPSAAWFLIPSFCKVATVDDGFIFRPSAWSDVEQGYSDSLEGNSTLLHLVWLSSKALLVKRKNDIFAVVETSHRLAMFVVSTDQCLFIHNNSSHYKVRGIKATKYSLIRSPFEKCHYEEHPRQQQQQEARECNWQRFQETSFIPTHFAKFPDGSNGRSNATTRVDSRGLG